MEILVAPKLKKYRKIGLALGGGGARGFALIGAVRAFEEANIKFDYRFEYKVDSHKKKRTDHCHLILKHAPTRSNFWHFNIWIESHNTENNVLFTNEVATDKLPSKRNMSKRAEASFMLLQNIVCMPEQTHEVKLPTSYYV